VEPGRLAQLRCAPDRLARDQQLDHDHLCCARGRLTRPAWPGLADLQGLGPERARGRPVLAPRLRPRHHLPQLRARLDSGRLDSGRLDSGRHE
jgi:hypothetical protein